MGVFRDKSRSGIFPSDIVSASDSSPLLPSPHPSFHLFSVFLSLCFSPLRMIWMLLPNAVPACHNLRTCCHSWWIRRLPLLSNISTLHSSVSPFIFPFSSSVHPPSSGDLLASWLSHPSPLALAWPCPPWVIYHGPGGEPLGLQAPVSPCNRLFVAPSKQVSDQQKSIKAWWAFLSQLGSGH